MNEKFCKDCAYYHQHYVFDQKKIFRVYCGHCTFSRVKRKLPDAPACERFAQGTTDEAAFATKEYLGKELVQYLLRLDLLPDIGEHSDGMPKRQGEETGL